MFNFINIIDIRHLKLFFFVVVMRFLHLCLVKSYFVPDEYWQSLEIAHRTVFGYGYVTWEWDKAIRSFFYPSWFALCYKILAILQLDYVEVLIFAPRILQSVLSAIADFYLWLWLNKPQLKLRRDQVHWTYIMWTMCLLVNYCSTRTLTNTAELNFSSIALYYFPWGLKRQSQKTYTVHFLWFVGLACLIRPTAVIQWLPLCIYDIISDAKPLKYFLTIYTRIIVKIMCLSLIIDFFYYNRFVLTPINFFLYNGQYNVGVHYGIHSWFWYILIGIPVVLGPVFIVFYFSVFRISRDILLQLYCRFIDHNKSNNRRVNYIEFILLFTVIWTIFWYSLVPHKEFRFVLPLTPIMIYLAGSNVNFDLQKSNHFYMKVSLVFISVCAITFNVFGLFYLGQWHQIGPINVMEKLAQVAKDSPHESNFLFLTPCHATPFYSHMHVNVTTRFLTCEPNLLGEKFYKDESDIFFENPQHWLKNYISHNGNSSLPSHIIFFSNLKSSIESFLNQYNYTQFDVMFNSYFLQGRQSQYIEIFHANKLGSF